MGKVYRFKPEIVEKYSDLIADVLKRGTHTATADSLKNILVTLYGYSANSKKTVLFEPLIRLYIQTQNKKLDNPQNIDFEKVKAANSKLAIAEVTPKYKAPEGSLTLREKLGVKSYEAKIRNFIEGKGTSILD